MRILTGWTIITVVCALTSFHPRYNNFRIIQSMLGAMPSAKIEDTSISRSSEEFRTIVKEFRRQNSPKKLLQYTQLLSNENKLDQNKTAFVFKTLQRMNRTDLSIEILPIWYHVVKGESVELESAFTVFKSLCRLKRADLASDFMVKSGVPVTNDREMNDYERNIGFVFLPELALCYALVGNLSQTAYILYVMKKNSITLELDISKTILKQCIHESDLITVRSLLKLLLILGGLYDYESTQLITSVFMKSVDFVKGAVSVDTLPPETYCEVAFMGRSNVGKSSLINMLCNRKGLAYTSKTPGKTSEFNYFNSSGYLSRNKKKDMFNFYLVDMPGVGYAEVAKSQRLGWLDLLKDYVASRGTLKALYHLVDSRHGLMDADKQCLELLNVISPGVQYIIVLTKVDKTKGGVREGMVESIRLEIQKYTKRRVPVLSTSSSHKEGGAMMWSSMLDALAGDSPLSLEDILPIFPGPSFAGGRAPQSLPPAPLDLPYIIS